MANEIELKLTLPESAQRAFLCHPPHQTPFIDPTGHGPDCWQISGGCTRRRKTAATGTIQYGNRKDSRERRWI
jgi:hypothetical protein